MKRIASLEEKRIQQLEETIRAVERQLQHVTKELNGANEQLFLNKEEFLRGFKTLEDENKIMLERNLALGNSNKQLASFSASASHDLQEPLRKIHLFCTMIIEDDQISLVPELNDYLTRIMGSANRMQKLIDDLLVYSEVNIFRREDFIKTDLIQLFYDAIVELDEKIHSVNARIEVGPLPDLYIIPPLVRQVFSNLISNSLKYRQESIYPIIGVTARVADNEDIKKFGGNVQKTYIKVTISDNGIGFQQEQADQIFQPFARLHSKDRFEGSGIGLAICKKIMIRHGGEILASGELGKGSTFDLFFPEHPTDSFANSEI